MTDLTREQAREQIARAIASAAGMENDLFPIDYASELESAFIDARDRAFTYSDLWKWVQGS